MKDIKSKKHSEIQKLPYPIFFKGKAKDLLPFLAKLQKQGLKRGLIGYNEERYYYFN